MEKQEKRVSRVERNSKKQKSSRQKSNKTDYRKTFESVDYHTDDEVINTSKTRVRRSERNKRKKRGEAFSISKNKESGISSDKNRHMKIAAFILIFIGILTIVGGLTLYFKSHFYFGTAINCIDVSGKDVEDVENEFKSNLNEYNLVLNGRDSSHGEIKGSDIELNYDENKKDEIQDIKQEQNKSSWIKAIFSKKENGISESSTYTSSIVSYNSEKLNNLIDNLEVVKGENISEPKNAYLKYDGSSFVIENEVQGNKINKDKLLKEILRAISSGERELDLDKYECYEKPEYTSSSEEVIEAQKKLNQYKDFKLTYEVGGYDEEISGDKLLNFFEFGDNYDCTLNDEKISSYVNGLCEKYNTYGTPHKFTTTDGISIIVKGGDYGYEINKDEEVNKIKEDIEGGKPVSRKPMYSKTALGDIINDIGNTYIEINMSKQHLWFYKDGALVTQGDVVTGNVANGTATPEGTYSLKYKVKDSVLVGEGYRTPVSFWMPFNNNIGIHDANWRSVFGGRIYLSGGSHGCVNAPYSLAQAIYSNIESGTPVICYN
ncbi:MAG: peptidoglycan binding domain-containing protein [Clostridium sp.]|nr:peptidoglycan binding domain-containing protein [Clostridium sp.]